MKIINTGIRDGEFIGFIENGTSPFPDGKYLVFIPQLMNSGNITKPIWVTNATNSNNLTRWYNPMTKQVESSGSYLPLQVGQKVKIKFITDDYNSGYITFVMSDFPLPDKASNRDSFYLLNKTKGGSWIYQDDARSVTQIIHNNGMSSITLDDERITIATGVPLNDGADGIAITNAFEVGKHGFKLEFGNNSITLDETGIMLKAGDSIISLNSSSCDIFSTNINSNSTKSTKIVGSEIGMTGMNEVSISSAITRVSGNQQASLTGNVVNVDSFSNTTIHSTGQLSCYADFKFSAQAPLIELISITNLYASAPLVTIGGFMFAVQAETTSIGSSAVFMDGTLMHNMGIGTSTSSSMVAMNTGLSTGTDLANMSLVTSLGNNDPITGATCTILSQSIPSSAKNTPETVYPALVSSNPGSHISGHMAYITGNDTNNKVRVNDPFTLLKVTHDI